MSASEVLRVVVPPLSLVALSAGAWYYAILWRMDLRLRAREMHVKMALAAATGMLRCLHQTGLLSRGPVGRRAGAPPRT
jgi:hypothetical protein